MTVIWSSDAEDDLRQIQDYIGERNPDAARRVAADIFKNALRLETWPRSGRAGRVEGTREAPVRRYPYILIYKLAGRHVEIVRVLHTAQNWPPGTLPGAEED